MYGKSLFASLLTLITVVSFSLPIGAGAWYIVTTVGQSNKLICKQLKTRDTSCYHRRVYLFGLWSYSHKPFQVREAVVEKYYPKSGDTPYTGYRLVFTIPTGKEFFYYGRNTHQAYADLKQLNDLLRNRGSQSLEFGYQQPLIAHLFLLLLILVFLIPLGIVFSRGLLMIPVIAIVNNKPFIRLLSIGLLILPTGMSAWFFVTMTGSTDQLSCERLQAGYTFCNRQTSHLFGTWSNISDFRVREAVVKEDYSESEWENGADTTYSLILTTSSGKEFFSYERNGQQAYTDLKQINDLLSGNSASSLKLRYNQTLLTQLFKAVLALTYIPLLILLSEVCVLGPILALVGIFIPNSDPNSNS